MGKRFKDLEDIERNPTAQFYTLSKKDFKGA